MPFGGRWQIIHNKSGVEGKESIRNVRAKGGNKGGNSGYFLLIYIPRDE
jgi:hypothetical protein